MTQFMDVGYELSAPDQYRVEMVTSGLAMLGTVPPKKLCCASHDRCPFGCFAEAEDE